MEKQTSYSQYNQDEFVDLYFKKKKGGFFLDIGANDGISHSNSYFFEKNRGWSGICIEPIPDVFKKMTEIRQSINYNVCISEEEGIVNFRRVHGAPEMLSGILEFMTPEHISRIKKECELNNGSYEDIKIESRNINSILESHGINKIDYLSIDTEGAELIILKTINFEKLNIEFLTVENNESSEEIRNFLKAKGYQYIPFFTDDFFIKSSNSLLLFRIKVLIYMMEKAIMKKLKKIFA